MSEKLRGDFWRILYIEWKQRHPAHRHCSNTSRRHPYNNHTDDGNDRQFLTAVRHLVKAPDYYVTRHTKFWLMCRVSRNLRRPELAAPQAYRVSVSEAKILLFLISGPQLLPPPSHWRRPNVSPDTVGLDRCMASCPSVRPSVRLSVTLRYRVHVGWNSAKIISRLISLTISLSAMTNEWSNGRATWPKSVSLYHISYSKWPTRGPETAILAGISSRPWRPQIAAYGRQIRRRLDVRCCIAVSIEAGGIVTVLCTRWSVIK